jgi:hypothetical protein
MIKAWISLDASSNIEEGLRLDFRFDNILIQSMNLTTKVQHFRHEFDDSASRIDLRLNFQINCLRTVKLINLVK